MRYPLIRLCCWFIGWRVDLDGWIVRARRSSNPTFLSSDVGFVEESAIAVRTFEHAWKLK